MINIKNIISVFSKIFKNNLQENKILNSNEGEVNPYFKSYSIDDSNEDGVALYLKSLDTPMNSKEYEFLFKSMINKEIFLDNKDNFKILTEIYNDVNIIYNDLKVLEKLGFSITLDLTGGAVRDFVMGKAKEITDLDIMISFNDTIVYDNNSEYSEVSFITAKNLKQVGFKEKNLDTIKWSDTEKDLNLRKTQLIQLCLLNKVEEIFTHTDSSRLTSQKTVVETKEDYIKTFKDRLCGVIKVKKQKNYKIDILITDLKRYEFLQQFDINLCKCSFVFKNKHNNKGFPSKPEYLLSRFSAEIDFFADIYNKKITVDVNEKSMNMLDSILNKHLPKVMAKYPDYQFNLVSSGNIKPNYLAEVNRKIFLDSLNNSLIEKEVKQVRRAKI